MRVRNLKEGTAIAITAASFTSVSAPLPLGGEAKIVTGIFTGPASYLASGEPLTNAIIQGWGLNKINFLDFTPLVTTTGTTLPITFDYVSTATTQGKIHVASDGNAANVPFAELASTTNISTLTCRFFAIGN